MLTDDLIHPQDDGEIPSLPIKPKMPYIWIGEHWVPWLNRFVTLCINTNVNDLVMNITKWEENMYRNYAGESNMFALNEILIFRVIREDKEGNRELYAVINDFYA